MRLTRILIDLDLRQGDSFPLPDQAHHHLIRVLRLREGQPFIAFDGHSDQEALAEITMIEKRQAFARIQSITAVQRESPLQLTLVQAISASDKMDITLQKSVELGVQEIIPVYSERSQHRMKAAQIEKKIRHWQGVIIHATEQSGRTRLARLHTPLPLTEHLDQRATDTTAIVLDPAATMTPRQLRRPIDKLEIHVGPEGGFTTAEIAMMDASNIGRLRLGPRILRTETAGIALIAWLQAELGDF